MSVQTWLRERPKDIERQASDVLSDMMSEGQPMLLADPVTYSRLALLFGRQAVGKIDEALRKVPGMDWVRIALSGQGLDFSTGEVQDGLKELVAAGVFEKPVGDALMALGVRLRTKWQERFGDAELPSVDTIKAAQVDAVAVPSEPPIPQDSSQVLLCVNITNGSPLISYRRQEVVDGFQVVNDVFTSPSRSLVDRQLLLVESVLAAVKNYVESE